MSRPYEVYIETAGGAVQRRYIRAINADHAVRLMELRLREGQRVIGTAYQFERRAKSNDHIGH